MKTKFSSYRLQPDHSEVMAKEVLACSLEVAKAKEALAKAQEEKRAAERRLVEVLKREGKASIVVSNVKYILLPDDTLKKEISL